jgi:hypothetical protein
VLGRGSTDEAARIAELEHSIRTLPGVRDAAVVTGRGAGYCMVESLADPAEPDLEDQVRRLCQRLSASPLSIALGPPGTFPRTPTGKLSRTGPLR